MSKTLITVDNLEQFICCGKLAMDNSKILTAGARDELTRRHIDIAWGEPGQDCCCQPGATSATCAAPAVAPCDMDTLIGVAAIIKEHYGITDPDVLRKVTLETAAAISKGANV